MRMNSACDGAQSIPLAQYPGRNLGILDSNDHMVDYQSFALNEKRSGLDRR